MIRSSRTLKKLQHCIAFRGIIYTQFCVIVVAGSALVRKDNVDVCLLRKSLLY